MDILLIILLYIFILFGIIYACHDTNKKVQLEHETYIAFTVGQLIMCIVISFVPLVNIIAALIGYWEFVANIPNTKCLDKKLW